MTSPKSEPRRGKVDYRDILSLSDFTLFAALRTLRKEIAQAEAVPVYTVVTNEQLAQIVQTRVATKADLERITGVGEARVEKDGSRILEFSQQRTTTDATSGPSV